MDFYIGQKFTGIYPPEAAIWCMANAASIDPTDGGYIIVEATPAPPALADYDAAMEQYLYDTRSARGYTAREPSDYAGSSVARWAADAADWIAFRDKVMLYALDVQNKFAETGIIPSLQEFVDQMPAIVWSKNDND